METIRTQLKNKIENHEMPPYLYTYPPKSAYERMTDWRAIAKTWRSVTGKISLYVHIPFCSMKCSFCDLFTVTNLHQNDTVERYIRCLAKELKLMKPYLNCEEISVESLYFGGGTPSLLTIEQLDSLFTIFHTHFKFESTAEISIEGAPNSFTVEKFSQLKALGFNRVSIGIQSFIATELKNLGRSYDADLGIEMGRAAVQSGISNVNLDLIYGLPDQTFECWQTNLQKAIDINPPTLTLYPLVIRNRTSFGKAHRQDLIGNRMNEENCYKWIDFNIQTLVRNGYQQQTFVNFVKDRGGCLYEQNSFQGVPCLSFGAGARKYAPEYHYVDDDYLNRKPNKITFLKYMEEIEQGVIPIKSGILLSIEEQARRFLILGLLSVGIHKSEFKRRFHKNLLESYPDYFEALACEALIAENEEFIFLTAKGKKYSNIIGDWLASDFVKHTRNRYK